MMLWKEKERTQPPIYPVGEGSFFFFLLPALGGEDIADNYQLEEMSLLCTGLKGETLQALRS